jgi:hypothetical protein
VEFTARSHYPLEIKTFEGESGQTYLVFRNHNDEFHVFTEVQAKEAAMDCGAPDEGNTQQRWRQIWDRE